MPIVETWVSNELFLDHLGVEIYHTYKDNCYNSGTLTYCYTTEEDGSEDGDSAFDVRDLFNDLMNVEALSEKEKTFLKKLNLNCETSHSEILKKAVEKGLIEKISVEESPDEEKRRVKSSHLSAHGNICPNCDSSDIHGEPFDISGEVAYQKIKCLTCISSWTNDYTLCGYTPLFESI